MKQSHSAKISMWQNLDEKFSALPKALTLNLAPGSSDWLQNMQSCLQDNDNFPRKNPAKFSL